MAYNSRPAAQEMERNELFAGGRPATRELRDDDNGRTAELTIDELVQKAEDTHQDTTAAARRALRVVQATQDVQANTMKELENQGQRMNRANQMVNKVNEDLTYSEKLLLYMRTCCCCWMCDSCTGADPEMQQKKQWRQGVEQGKTSQNDKAGAVYTDKDSRVPSAAAPQGAKKSSTTAGPSSGGAPMSKAKFVDPHIQLTEEHRGKELQLQAETRKQNELLDEIHTGLDAMLNNAKAIGGELDEQNKAAAVLRDRVENTKDRIANVNTKSQLKKYKVKQ